MAQSYQPKRWTGVYVSKPRHLAPLLSSPATPTSGALRSTGVCEPGKTRYEAAARRERSWIKISGSVLKSSATVKLSKGEVSQAKGLNNNSKLDYHCKRQSK